jgi:imidazoleglycerol-phosphate dehydratase/histidinol-phosphatase
MARAPFLPLIADAEGLDAFPEPPRALIARMAEIYNVDEDCVLPTQGVAQALAIVTRRIAMDGAPRLNAPDRDDVRQIAAINRVALTEADAGAEIVSSPSLDAGVSSLASIAARSRALGDALLIVDESLIEFEDAPSATELIGAEHNLVVIRSLALAYGLAGAPCAALLANPALIARLNQAQEPGALATPIVRLARAALEPARVAANLGRIADVRAERARVAAAIPNAKKAAGPFVWISPPDKDQAESAIRRLAVDGQWRDERFLLNIGAPEANDRALAAFGVSAAPPRRSAETVRETQETRIVVRADLDREGPAEVSTGIGFFDHMLSQIALHGGFALTLACDGDLDVDGHHTIEDCALALGQTLKQALGARRGLARFGFVLPMDEAEAKVSIDLGGRPYLVFEGAFAASHIGAYPTEMTEHVFRSLAQSMGAAIHVHVTGENDHHKTEACYKAFGRAMRQALRVEGEVLPSTKGAI